MLLPGFCSQGEHYRELHYALEKRGYKVGAVVMMLLTGFSIAERVFVIAVDKKIPNR